MRIVETPQNCEKLKINTFNEISTKHITSFLNDLKNFV